MVFTFPIGRKFFPFSTDLFLEGLWCDGKQAGSHKIYLPVNIEEKLPGVSVSLNMLWS